MMKNWFVIGALFVIALALPTSAQTTQASAFVSPCPNVFMYEPPGSEVGKWYGLVNLTTETTLYALWLNIVLESKADILGNWVGEVTTDDNIDFKIENTKMKISPGPPLSIRFFIQYNPQDQPPKLKAIRFNGREICNVNNPVENVEYITPVKTDINIRTDIKTTTTVRTTVTTSRSIDRHTTLKPSYWTDTKQQTTLKPQYWTQAKTETRTTTSKPQYWQETKVDNTHQVKTDPKQITTSTPQQWSTGKVEKNIPTTPSPGKPIWPHVKVDNIQLDKLETKHDTNNQQKRTQNSNVKNELKQPIKIVSISKSQTENLLQTTQKVTTQSSIWAQYNIENKQQTKHEDKLKTKNENKSQTTVITPVWPNVKVPNNQNAQSSGQTRNENNSPTDIKQTQYWPKITVEDEVKSDRNSEKTSRTRIENGQQISHYDNKPIYVRPDETGTAPIVSDDITDYLHPKPEDSYSKITDDILQIRHDGRLEVRPIKRQKDENENGQTWAEDSTSNWSGDHSESWSDQSESKDRITFESAGESTINNDGRIREVGNVGSYNDHFTATPPRAIVPVIEDFVSEKEEDTDYFGGVPTIYIPNHAPRRTEPQCGKVYLNNQPPDTRRGPNTLEGQWPWQIALYQQQTTVDFKYICGGTLVSRRHIITAAHCVTKKGSRRVVNQNTLTVYLGKHNLRTSVEGVQVKFVSKIIIHPEYNATTFSRDLAILELRESVAYTNWVQPVCLWPEDEIPLRYIIGKKGSLVGWGFEASGTAREELNLLEMPVVDQETCINSYRDFFKRFVSDYTYCAGYKPGTSVCNGDSGGGMVFQKGSSWYLRGLASLSVARQGEYRCDPDHYVIFTDIAKLMPWVEEHIEDY